MLRTRLRSGASARRRAKQPEATRSDREITGRRRSAAKRGLFFEGHFFGGALLGRETSDRSTTIARLLLTRAGGRATGAGEDTRRANGRTGRAVDSRIGVVADFFARSGDTPFG